MCKPSWASQSHQATIISFYEVHTSTPHKEQCALHMRDNFFPSPLTSSPTKALSEVLVLDSLLKEQGAERV